jgi:hypothetical protein
MGEVKRIFNQAKIDRDTDARMVQPGFHRDALNVSVGESEGGDVGAVENLKGNEEISGQADVEGTTIGSIVDPNNDRVYWFNTSSVFDAIYEYDKTTNAITTILREPKARTATLPTCSPTLQARITDPVSGRNNRPSPDPLPSNPVGGCTDPSATNYLSTAEYDNGLCTYSSNIGVTISGDGSFPNSSSPVTLTANVTNANGAFTYLWNTGETTQTISISGSNTTITGSTPGVTVTDSYGSATDNYSVNFYTPQATTYTKTLIVDTSGVSGMSNGQVTGDVSTTQRQGTYNQPWSFSTGISTNQGYSYSGTTPILQSGLHTDNSSVTTAFTGAITADSTPTFDFTGTTIDNTGTNISAAGGQSYLDKNSATTISYTSTATLDSGYEWVQVPTATDNGLPSGVTMSAISGSGTTSNRYVTISGTWQATSDVSPNVTWSGGSAQQIPQRRSTSISSYGGVTTSAQCASRSMPVTVYFSNTSSPYTGIQNGDTLYTSATGTGVYSSGSGYKTNVANGYGTALGTITISNGVVSNSNTSFC